MCTGGPESVCVGENQTFLKMRTIFCVVPWLNVHPNNYFIRVCIRVSKANDDDDDDDDGDDDDDDDDNDDDDDDDDDGDDDDDDDDDDGDDGSDGNDGNDGNDDDGNGDDGGGDNHDDGDGGELLYFDVFFFWIGQTHQMVLVVLIWHPLPFLSQNVLMK